MAGIIRTEPEAVKKKLLGRLFGRGLHRSRRRIVRYGLLGANVLLLVAVLGFVLRSSGSSQSVQQSSALTTNSAVTNPLDQVSSADIAVSVARLTNLAEAVSVTNRADSVNAQLAITPADTSVVAKPQVVATDLKSRKDIQKYTVVAGDTVSSVAAKFSVTSDTIRASNDLTGDALSPGRVLLILPGVNGIIYTVRAGDTPDSLATKYNANKEQIVAYNDAEISGLVAGTQIIIPNGILPGRAVAASSYYGGFAGGSFAATYGFNGYDYGWCTWYAANKRAQLGSPVPSNLGNAYSWYILAQRAGLPTGLTPQVGAVAVNQGGNHVSVVEAVNPDGSFWVSEMNSRGQVSMTNPAPAGGWARVDYKLYASPGNLKFIY